MVRNVATLQVDCAVGLLVGVTYIHEQTHWLVEQVRGQVKEQVIIAGWNDDIMWISQGFYASIWEEGWEGSCTNLIRVIGHEDTEQARSVVQDTADSELTDSTAGDEVRSFGAHFKNPIELAVMRQVNILDDTDWVDQLICGGPTTSSQRCP